MMQFSIFSADDASDIVIEKLSDFGIKYITLRSVGYDNVNLKTANRLGIKKWPMCRHIHLMLLQNMQ